MNKEYNDLFVENMKLRDKLEKQRREYQDTYKDVREEIKDYKNQLEEKDKKYAKIRDEIYDYLDSDRFCENFENVDNEKNVREHIFEILERGKNGKKVN